MRVDLIKFRVHVEGVLVPDISAVTVQCFASEEARATIVFPSIPGFETEDLKRARVHIFWSDIDIRDDRSDDEWPILFEGEITSDSYQKTPTSRHQMFYCTGYHSYWQQVLLYFYDLGSGNPNKAAWASQQMSVALGNNKFTFEGGVAGANLRQRLATEVQTHTGEQYHSIVKRVFSQCLDTNHFFRLANAALRLDARFISADDKNLDVLLGTTLIREAITKQMSKVSGQVSMMDLLKDLLALFRYQIICNPQPVLLDQENRVRKTAKTQEEQIAAIREQLKAYAQAPAEGVEPTDVAVNAVMDAADGTNDQNTLRQVAKDLLKSAGVTALATEENTNLRLGIEEAIINFDAQIGAIGNPENWDLDKSVALEDGDLLSQYMLLPDTRFSLPPSCNVFYPGEQTQLSLDRQLMQEPTRGITEPSQDLGVPFVLYMAPPELGNTDGTGAAVPSASYSPRAVNGFHPPVPPEAVRVSSRFGPRQVRQQLTRDDGTKVWVDHPTASKYHRGLDFARRNKKTTSADEFMKTPVYAFDDGEVIYAGTQYKKGESGVMTGYGRYIKIRHDNGLESRYAHLKKHLVATGQKVTAGQEIGLVGNSGIGTGPHLHFEIRERPYGKDDAVDPYPYYQKAVDNYNGASPSTTTQDPEPVESESKTMKQELEDKSSKTFLDYKYLTPEEQDVGIVPFFDNTTLGLHTFMNFLSKEKGEDAQNQEVDNYYRYLLNSEFLWRRYQTRSIGALTLPFTASPVAGFPGLVVDRVRSIIGLVTSVTHSIAVDGGSGTATTTVQMEGPRYWDEGDPYYWVGGKADNISQKYAGKDRSLPNPATAKFPIYYLQSLVPTNSTETNDEWWSQPHKALARKTRPIDVLYKSLLGCGAIDYGYAAREVASKGTTVAFNQAIDGRAENKDGTWTRDKERFTNTIVGQYYQLADSDPEQAAEHVKKKTRRLGISEREIMTLVLGCESNDLGRTYTGAPFRSRYQDVVSKMNGLLEERRFRG